MSIVEIIPLIQSLQHADKLRLMAFLLGEIAQEDGVSLSQDVPISTHQIDALAMIASIAQPIGPKDLARNFDHYTRRILVDDFE